MVPAGVDLPVGTLLSLCLLDLTQLGASVFEPNLYTSEYK